MDIITHKAALGLCNRLIARARRAAERGDVKAARLLLATAIALLSVATLALLVDLLATVVLAAASVAIERQAGRRRAATGARVAAQR